VKALLLVVAAAVGLVAGSAGAAPTRDLLIRPGQGIGKVNIGMTEAQVRARLGRPGATRTRVVGFGSRFVELQYQDGHYWVGLLGRTGRMRVHSVGTIQEFQRTRQGFGLGTREARLAREYGARMRCDRLRINDRFSPAFVDNRWRDCVVNRGSGAETVFVTALPSHVRRVFVGPGDWRGLAVVIEVRVRRGALPS
jgi:hypothetical protein